VFGCEKIEKIIKKGNDYNISMYQNTHTKKLMQIANRTILILLAARRYTL
jgi:hypothetical protein